MMRPAIDGDQLPAVEGSASSDGGAVIEGRGLVKQFGRTDALNGLDIRVPRGSVYALLGRNGAGKSTLIQLLMGMLDPTKGSLSVLGLDPVRESVALKQRLGYIPERLPMYDWMTVAEILRFVAGFYTGWSPDEERTLSERFRLKPEQKVGALSRGNRALLSLVIAMAHKPELVLLDECTSGMDAIARREFERSVIDALQTAGRTVLFAGHQIDEMERICDWVGIVHEGRMLVEMPLDALKSSVKLLRLGGDPAKILATLPGCTMVSSRLLGHETLLTVRMDAHDAPAPALPEGVLLLETVSLSLEEIFVALVEAEEAK